ncbi:hypothetical protein [Roseateles depolymerans]|uniref:Uncharacterized protein n=1 Tax=Roseateles depolymerans TaxID=76731 RepID=A0A0U3MGB4_9BURK|nr:hypothetical protein [Roseateles depolymerans]ALV06540.1 hypothetical protein RD2015_2064 [Roseateles depolymerans]REG19514.1 hypothetical protein DES44_2010 [Roseateles depolymerans]
MFAFRNIKADEYCAVPGHDPDEPPTRTGPANVSASTPIATGVSGASGAPGASEVHPELASPVALYLKVMESVRPLREWAPDKGRLKELLDKALAAEAVALKGGTPSAAERQHAVQLASDLAPFLHTWDKMRGVREKKMEHYEWTLTQPLKAPFDDLVQRQLAQAGFRFGQAHRSFLQGHLTEALQWHDAAMDFCALADALIECERIGTPEHAQMLSLLFDLGMSVNSFKGFKGLIADAPWRAGTSAAKRSKVSRTTASSVPRVSSPAATGDAAGVGLTVGQRLQSLRETLAPSPLQLQVIGVCRGTPAEPLADPGGRMKAALDLLIQERPHNGTPATPRYLSLLGALETEVQQASALQQLRHSAAQAQASLETFLESDPFLKDLLKHFVNPVRAWQLESAQKAQRGHYERAHYRARVALESATACLVKAKAWTSGDWPSLPSQVKEWKRLADARVQSGRDLKYLTAQHMVERFHEYARRFDLATDPAQADQALAGMAQSLKLAKFYNQPYRRAAVNGASVPAEGAASGHPSSVSVATQTDPPIDLPIDPHTAAPPEL